MMLRFKGPLSSPRCRLIQVNQRAEMTSPVGVPEERRDNVANRRKQLGADR